MALYQYVKSPPKTSVVAIKRRPQAISFFLMAIGLGILLWTAWPIVSFAVFTAPLFSGVVSPIASTGGTATLSPVVLAATSEDTQQPTLDYTNANIWFPTAPQKKVVTGVNSYTVSIPKLRIKDATVIIAGDDLSKSLIHYGGTGLPGEYGTTVIFGHSILPQFYDPTNYKAIFSLLPTLKVGDDIFVTYDGITYRYVVDEMVVTEPNDLSSLEQKFDASHLTLITCVPPGTYWKRLNVKATLVKPPAT